LSQAIRHEQAPPVGSGISRVGVLRSIKLLLLVAMVALVAWGARTIYLLLDVPIAVIGVNGELKRVKTGEVESIVAGSLGGGFLSLDLEGICHALEEHPWIATASARRKWPNEVVISVEEEAPIARWGESHFLTAKGRVAEIAGADLPEELPHLMGPEGMERRVMQQYKNFTQVLDPLGLKVEACYLAARGNWMVTFDNGMELAVGKEPVVDKLNRFLRVWDAELKQRADHIARVDIRYANGVAVKWKENTETGALGGGNIRGR